MADFNPTRRNFLKVSAAAGGAVATGTRVPDAAAATAATQSTQATQAPADVNIMLRVNGKEHQVMLDARTTLLDALRERLPVAFSMKTRGSVHVSSLAIMAR